MSAGHKILVGSYTNAVTTLLFTPGTSPTLTVTSELDVGHHPAEFTRFWGGKRTVVFAGLEGPDGTIAALEFDADGKGTVLGKTPTGGKDPCTLAVLRGGDLVVGNYSSGNIVTIPLSPAPPYLPEGFAVHTNDIQFSGTGPRTDRQDASHPHHVYYPQNELLVADLGADKVWRLGGTSVREVVGAIDFAPGGGPRHVLYHDGILYTVLELSSELAAHTLPALPKEPQHLGTVSTYGAGSPPNKEALAAEILFIPARAGAPPRLLVSNRNDTHEGGDTIAVFALADKAGTPPRLIGEVRTGLKHIRGMSVDPSNNYLVTGGLHGPGVKVFEIADEGEWLREIASVEVASPTAFMWI